MAQLSTTEKQILEHVFQMGGGYVLDFSNKTISVFFRDNLNVDIYADEYSYNGNSKANRMRCFWEMEEDALVGESIIKLIDYINTQIKLNYFQEENYSADLKAECIKIGNRLLGKKAENPILTEDEFLQQEFDKLQIRNLQLDSVISEVLEQRMNEIQKCLQMKCALATIFLCGSTLEGILLGIALCHPQKFNSAKASPKNSEGRPKQFHEWTLQSLIDCAEEVGCIGKDVKKFSHALRDFRNFIHPHEQASNKFNPDDRTAEICWKVLQLSIDQITKYQRNQKT